MAKKIILSLLCLTLIYNPIDGKSVESSEKKGTVCYNIKKIKSRNNIYIIYAQRNDTLFKILSSKEKNPIDSGYKKICKGGCYPLDLESLFPSKLFGVKLMPPGSTGRSGINFDGTLVEIEPKKGIWDLFYAKNLKGLYIIEQDR